MAPFKFCILFWFMLLIHLSQPQTVFRSVTLTPSDTSIKTNGATIMTHYQEVHSSNNTWNANILTQNRWQFILTLDDSWGFYPNVYSSIQVTINAPSITTAPTMDWLVVGIATGNTQYISSLISMDNTKQNQIYPPCDISSTPTQTYGIGDLASILNTDRSCDIADGSCANWSDMLPRHLPNNTNAFPFTFQLDNDALNNALSLSFRANSHRTEFVQRCGFIASPTNRGLKVYIGGDATGQSFKIKSVQISGSIKSITKQPTMNPTKTHTNMPSVSPSDNPTQFPTNIPSLAPTHKPTPIPSNDPSVQPTVTPSDVPSNVPSVSPTFVPTVYPSETPSMPSVSPTISPSTSIPSASPSNTPSSLPPTWLPTNGPTNNPTNLPTNIPTNIPTGLPTVAPSSSPSFYPTVSPSNEPTSDPSMSRVNVKPLMHPTTMYPTSAPTMEPIEFSDDILIQATGGGVINVTIQSDDLNTIKLMVCGALLVLAATIRVGYCFYKRRNKRFNKETDAPKVTHLKFEPIHTTPTMESFLIRVHYQDRQFDYTLHQKREAEDEYEYDWDQSTFYEFTDALTNAFGLHFVDFQLFQFEENIEEDIDDIEDITVAFDCAANGREPQRFIDIHIRIVEDMYTPKHHLKTISKDISFIPVRVRSNTHSITSEFDMHNNWDDVIRTCQRIIRTTGESREKYKAYKRLGYVEERKGNMQKAMKYYRRALNEEYDDILEEKVIELLDLPGVVLPQFQCVDEYDPSKTFTNTFLGAGATPSMTSNLRKISTTSDLTRMSSTFETYN
eukprot:147451_1